MRLGQLARKYNVNQDEVILFLNEVQAELSPFHHNSKLSSDIEDLVIGHFSLSSKAEEEAIEEHSEDIRAEADDKLIIEDDVVLPKDLEVSEIDRDKTNEADLQLELDPTLPSIKTPVIEKEDENSIETDRLLELLEADEASNDLSKITHIKAPKKELRGLKVVGRIELAEPKAKSVDKSEDQDKEPNPIASNKQQGQRLSEEEKENRRLKAKEKKEQYEARQKKRRLAGEKKKRKAQNKGRYEDKMMKVKAGQAKQKIQKEEVVPAVNDQPQAPKPKTILGKILAMA